MGHRLAPTGINRQALLSAVQRLDLALLVDTENQGVLRRVEVESDDINQLLYEFRVVADLERPDQVWLQSVGAPDTADHRAAGPQHFRECSRAPVSGIGRLLLRGHLDDLPDESVACLGRTPTSRGIFLDPWDAPLRESVAPATDRGTSDAHFRCDALVLQTVGSQQDDTRPLNQSGLSATTTGPPLQGRLILDGKSDFTGTSHKLILLPQEDTRDEPISFMNSVTLH